MKIEKQYSIINPKDNTEIFFNDLKEETSQGDSIEYLIRNYPTAYNEFYQKFSIFNPREKIAWSSIDVDIKEEVGNHLKKEMSYHF